MNRTISQSLRVAFLVVSALAAAQSPATANEPAVLVRAVPDGGLPVVARVTKDGSIHLAYELNKRPMYALSKDGGQTFIRTLPVVPKSPDPRLTFEVDDMAVTEGGRVYVVMHTDAWRLKLPPGELALQLAVLEPGKQAFDPVRNINQMPSSGYSVTAADEKRVSLTWFSKTLYWSTSQDAGATFTPNTVIDPSYWVCECCTTRAVYGANGNLAIMYREKTDNHRDIYLVRIAKDGTHTRTPVSKILWDINACPMTYWALEPAGDGYLAAWPTRGKLYFTKIGADGTPLNPREIMTDGTITMRSQPLALTNPAGTTLIGWRERGEMRWQLYDPQNNPIGPRGSAPGASLAAAGAVDKAGQFIVFP